MVILFAHGSEVHTTALEATAHSLAWYIQIPLLVIAVIGFSGSVWFVTRKYDLTILITAFALLVAGFALFRVAPVISIVSITVGLLATLLVTLFGLGDQPSPARKTKD